MRRPILVVLLIALVTAPALAREPQRPVEVVRSRMEHHLREVSQITAHFESVLVRDCPRFESAQEWRTYLNGEIDRMVLLIAHLEQAWIEAKHTGDDDVRRTAKAPRRLVERARALLDKFTRCAGDHGLGISPMAAWKRIEREVPQRQSEIALPE